MALSKDRNTEARTKGPLNVFKVKGATTIYAGALVAVDANGFLLPAADAANLKVMGRADEQVVNAGADGAKSCRVEQGVFKWANSGAAAVDQAALGHLVYAEDDQTVRKTGGTNNIKAGLALQIDPDDAGIWVATFPDGNW